SFYRPEKSVSNAPAHACFDRKIPERPFGTREPCQREIRRRNFDDLSRALVAARTCASVIRVNGRHSALRCSDAAARRPYHGYFPIAACEEAVTRFGVRGFARSRGIDPRDRS